MTLALFAAEHVAATESKEAEFHPTPAEVGRALIQGMRAAGHEPLPLDVCAETALGEGALVRAINLLVPNPRRVWYGIELREDALFRARANVGAISMSFQRGDFLAGAGEYPTHATAITNPPWSRALEWAEESLRRAQGRGVVALHVPLATVETPERAAFFRKHPADLYPLEWRPNYDGRGTVSRAVCWLVWGPGRGGRWFPLTRTVSA